MNLKLFPMFLILFFILINSIAFPDNLEENLSIDKILPDMYVITHAYPWPSNSLLAVMENGEILLVDTPYTPRATKTVLDWIENKFGNRTIKAINTHFHVDRLGGNEALKNRNIPIYSSELTTNAIEIKGKNSLNLLITWITNDSIKNYYKNFKYIPPTNIFDSKKGLVLNFNNEKVIVKFIGIGHSIDNLIVYFPKKKVIFGGCMILSSEAKNAGNVSDGDIVEWRKNLNRIDTNNYTIVIPGHGKIGGVNLIHYTKSILK